jgi:hypothetical protein
MSQLFELFDVAGKTKYVRKSHCISNRINKICEKESLHIKDSKYNFSTNFFFCVLGKGKVHILHQCASYREIAKKNIPIINYTYSLSLLCQVQKM